MDKEKEVEGREREREVGRECKGERQREMGRETDTDIYRDERTEPSKFAR